MAKIIETNEMMFTAFEPVQKFRYIMDIEGIPTYMIKSSAQPSYTAGEVQIPHINVEFFVKGKSHWDEMTITLIDPITPSGAQIAMEWIRAHHESVTGRDGYADFYKRDISLNLLGPVGGVIRSWTLKGAFVKSANFGDLAWDSEDLNTIEMGLRYDYAILNY